MPVLSGMLSKARGGHATTCPGYGGKVPQRQVDQRVFSHFSTWIWSISFFCMCEMKINTHVTDRFRKPDKKISMQNPEMLFNLLN